MVCVWPDGIRRRGMFVFQEAGKFREPVADVFGSTWVTLATMSQPTLSGVYLLTTSTST